MAAIVPAFRRSVRLRPPVRYGDTALVRRALEGSTNMKFAAPTRSSARALLAISLVCLAWVASAQQPAGRGAQPQGTMANFTGGVRSVESTDVRASRFQYDAGARSYWHSHSGVQLLL